MFNHHTYMIIIIIIINAKNRDHFYSIEFEWLLILKSKKMTFE